jgi:hypothetical protein
MQVSNEIINVFEYLGEKFGIAIDWTSTNVIPYIEQLCGRIINYEIATSVFWLVFGVIIGVISFFAVKKGWTLLFDEDDEVGMPLIVFGAIGFVAFIIITLTQVHNIITALTLPEITILNHIRVLMSNG